MPEGKRECVCQDGYFGNEQMETGSSIQDFLVLTVLCETNQNFHLTNGCEFLHVEVCEFLTPRFNQRTTFTDCNGESKPEI